MKKIILTLVLILGFCLLTSTCFATFISNADIDDEDMADITDWTDQDSGTGTSTQATFDSKSCMKLDSGGTPAGNATAKRGQDIGSFGNRTVFSLSLYHDAIGTQAQNDRFVFDANDGATTLSCSFASDGLFVFNGAAYVEVGTDLVSQDVWQEWSFDVDWVAQTVDVYLDGVLKASDIDCSYATITTEGIVSLYQKGATTANRLTYIDWFKAGSDWAAPPPAGGIFEPIINIF